MRTDGHQLNPDNNNEEQQQNLGFHFLGEDTDNHYNECVGPDLSQICIPTDDPPPYSLLDPCWSPARSEEQPPHSGPPDASQYCGETSASIAWSSSSSSASSHCALGLHEREQQHIACISFPTPPYDAVLGQQGQPLPLMPCNLNKHSDRDYDENSQQLPANHIS
ncbi:hypothetical protein CCH79_00020461 [Gambusia affinis]|uniref:Uncharacterized protein n=1 Tax=Gambusia affinis TaxID=33528 RepID=A0A315VRX8_GAMAF|nr:hypothetical protein CCH79_00020461 [Gambusia affinis]